VEGSGPFNFGDFPDDPDETLHDDDLRPPAWLPPEDRLWRHPSEVARHGHPQGEQVLPADLRVSRRDRRSTVTAGVAGAAAVATAVVVAFTLTSSPQVPSSQRDVRVASFVTTTVVSGITAPLVIRMMAALRPSLIAISPPDGSRSAHMTGVVLPGGDLAVTAAAAVGAATHVDIVTPSGQRRRVRVLGTDPHSGIAVVGTGGGLTPASFSDGSVEPGELAIAACLCGTAGTTAANDPAAAVGEVRKVGAAATLDSGTGLVDTIEADMPLGQEPWGGVLLDGLGRVVGVLDARESMANGHSGVFVPASLAVAVAQELATSHKVDHGWLGIKCTDVPGSGGARIAAIMAGSPAASAGLHEGDVVAAVDLHAVDSLADLQARLYTSPPGTTVNVMVVRSGRDMMSALTLAGSPTG
jgi:putative serine protease PepD